MQVIPLTDTQRSTLASWRARALEKMPYMASLLFNLRPLNAPGLHTFATDRWFRLYVDFDGVADWSNEACAEILLHECFHLFAHDAERADEFGVTVEQRSLWNVAADAANNDDLLDAGCKALKDTGGVFPCDLDQPNHKTAEIYMASLLANQPPPPPSGGPNGETGTSGGCGSASGGGAAPCELAPENSAGGAAPAATDIERRVVDIVTASEIREWASKHPGAVPGGLVEMAEQRLRPSEVPWRTVLASVIRRAAAMRAGDFDTTYQRRNRRRGSVALGGGRRAIIPGIYSPSPNLVVVRDTSGSMSYALLNAVSSEIDGIAKQLGVRGTDLIVLDVDTQVAAKATYRSVSDLATVAGRGGTDMNAGIAAALEMNPRPNAIIVITDGYTPMPATKVAVPVVFCIVGPGADDAIVIDSIPSWVRVVKVPRIE